MKKSVIILGAGPAGLTAGYEILQRMGSEYTVTIIEKTPFVGGMCRTVETGKFAFDIGGHRYLTSDKEIMSFWKSFLPEEHFLTLQRHSHIFFHGQTFMYPISLSWKEMKTLGIPKTMRIILSYAGGKIHHKSVETLEDYYISRFGRELYALFFESYTRKVCGQHPSEISPEWGYQRVGALSVTKILSALFKKQNKQGTDMKTVTDRFNYPKYGSGELWTGIAEKIIRLGGGIITNDQAAGFCWDRNRIISVECSSGQKLQADYIISSVPMRDLLALIPQTPPPIADYGKCLVYRDIVVAALLFRIEDVAGLREPGELAGDQWIYIQDEGYSVGRIQIINNWSGSMITEKNCIGLILEYYMSEDDASNDCPYEAWIKRSTSELSRLGFVKDGAVLVDHAILHQEKAYPCYSHGYKYIYELHQYLDTIENLACIGRNGQHNYSNVDKVMLSAFKAVDWMEGKCEKADIWLK